MFYQYCLVKLSSVRQLSLKGARDLEGIPFKMADEKVNSEYEQLCASCEQMELDVRHLQLL